MQFNTHRALRCTLRTRGRFLSSAAIDNKTEFLDLPCAQLV